MKMFDNYLKKTAEAIEILQQNFSYELEQSVGNISPKLSHLFHQFIKSCANGKRLRGTLVKLGFDMIKESTNDILEPALAYEIFQTAILAHDDIIDKSPTRRGKQSMYMALGGEHYGISQTICLGDIGMFIANKLIINSKFNETVKNKALKSFQDTLYNTGIGELLDVELPNLDISVIGLNDILTVHQYKTSYYTFVGPLHLGAVLAEADDVLLEQLKIFGINLGIAFQIKDDILGIFSDEQTIGKSNKADIEEKKITTIWLDALHNANEEQKKLLLEKYGKQNVSNEDIECIKKIFIDTKSLEKSEKLMNKYASTARNEIDKMNISDTYKVMLYELCDYTIERKK